MNIGAPEIVLLAIFALIFFGPKRLPDLARQVGRALAEVRRVSREFEREVREVTDPVEREIRDAEQVARDTYRLDADHSRFAAPDDADGAAEPKPALGPGSQNDPE
ncbi:MAG: Sec-independent protein translocase subunit TatA/TatB [Actinomycetota bacterium]